MKTFKTLRIFGGSTSVPGNFVDPQDSFWGLTALAMDIDHIVNYSWNGCGFDSIIHIMISEQLEFNWDNDFFLVVVPPLERWTVFDNHKNTQTTARLFDTKKWQSESFEVKSHRGLINISFHMDKSTVMFEDRAWTEVNTMKNIFFLTQWLDSIKANYLIVNGSKPMDKDNVWAPNAFLLPYCLSHPKINIFSNTYSSVNINVNWPSDFDDHSWNGHHAAPGNQRFFELGILPCLKILKLC